MIRNGAGSSLSASPRLIRGRDWLQTWRAFLPPLFLGVSLLGIYLRTLAPGLTWANGGSDGGDLITAAATGGIPHPTGYPLYLLLAGIFQRLPLGSLASRTNLMSAVFTAAACVLIYEIVAGQLSASRAIHRMFAGLAAGCYFGLAPLVWSQAVITEVYALQAFLVTSIIVLYTMPAAGEPSREKALDVGRGLVVGLAMGNHMTTLLLVPIVLLLGATQPAALEGQQGRLGWRWLPGQRFDPGSLGRQLLGLALGLSLYLILPLRAMAHPPVSWGNPVTLEGLIWLVTGKLYQSYYLQFDFSRFLEQAQSWAQFSVRQVGLPGLILALLGLVVFGKFSRLFVLTVAVAVASLAFSLVYHPAEAAVYLLPLLISFSIWLGLGVGELADVLARRSPALAIVVSLLMLGIVLFRSFSLYQQVDASLDVTAEAFGGAVLSQAPANALLFAEGDRAIFALWYFHFALHQRPDLVVIASELVPFAWYQENLRLTYPSLSVPGPVVFPETIIRSNPNRPVCQIRYDDGAVIECTTQ